MNRYSILFLFLFLFCSSYAVDLDKDSIINMTATEMTRLYQTSSSQRVGVHDPSIVFVKDPATDVKTYYIFGSHRACASSVDLKNWKNVAWYYGAPQTNGSITSTTGTTGVFVKNQTKKVNVLKEGKEIEVNFGNFNCEQWRYTANNPSLNGNQWAPDVMWNPVMKKWCMYMSLNGDNWRSVIVLLTADNITGPYVYQGPVVFSGFQWSDLANQTYKQTDLELVIGTQSSLPKRYAMGSLWGDRWPNNIDPCVFYDEDGQLWMCYGSWSGGIFILKLDEKTGLRDYTQTYPAVNNESNAVTSDPYFGKKIAGGYYSSGEGPYIEHIGNYYYLFISNGGLEAGWIRESDGRHMGGYEMHYFRSQKPDGPYTDANGESAVYPKYIMNYGPTAGTTRGMKIIGSHKWNTMKYAEVSEGHNSLLLDEDGRAYLFYHTRFNNGTEGFEVRVHQLFVNEKGWLVTSPFEFNGLNGTNSQYTVSDVESTQICTKNDVIGTYQIMMHPYKVDFVKQAYSKPGLIELKKSGVISGDYYGSWSLKSGTSFITLKLRPKGTSVTTDYYGVVVPQVYSGTNAKTIAFTAISSAGVSVWGSNMDGNYAVDYNYTNVLKPNFPYTSRLMITKDINIPELEMQYGATIRWTSEHPELISNDGKLLVPYVATGDSIVMFNMTATIQKDNYAYSFARLLRIRTNKSVLCEPQDINYDGTVDTQDILAVYDFMMKGTVAGSAPEDVNKDGVVDTQDVLMIYEYIQNH